MNPTIGIVIIATNAYFVLGIRFIKKFNHFYNGNANIRYYFFSDVDPTNYLKDDINVCFIKQSHTNWTDGTNSKFTNIISLEKENVDYLFYFDADTNISKTFDENWFIGDLVGGQHFGDQSWMKDNKAYDRNPMSMAYIPYDTSLPQMYYLGAFFGGEKNKVINFCKTLKSWQIEDKKIPYEPAVNDESYINKYFHNNKPHTVMLSNFQFIISDKGGIQNTRNTNLDIDNMKNDLLAHKNLVIEIQNGEIVDYEI